MNEHFLVLNNSVTQNFSLLTGEMRMVNGLSVTETVINCGENSVKTLKHYTHRKNVLVPPSQFLVIIQEPGQIILIVSVFRSPQS